jgi:hypothetical protein
VCRSIHDGTDDPNSRCSTLQFVCVPACLCACLHVCARCKDHGLIPPTSCLPCRFLAKTEGLHKTTIGENLGEREEVALKVMHAYVDNMAFEDHDFDDAIRGFLQVG